MKRARVTLSNDSDKSDHREDNLAQTPTVDSVEPIVEYDTREGSMEPVGSFQAAFPQGRVGPGRRSRYSMNYQSYEATRIQPAEQTRRMLDYMFPGYQKRDPRNWYEKATQTNLNRDEVNSLIGIELTEVEPIEADDKKSVGDKIHIPVEDDDDDEHFLMTQTKFQKPARSSVVAKGWDGPPIKVTGKTSEEGFLLEIHDLQHDPQAIMVPKEVLDQKTLRLDVVPDERGVPKVVVYVGEERSSVTTVESPVSEETVVVYDNKEEFQSQSVSSSSVVEPIKEEEPEHVPTPPPETIPDESSEDVIAEIPARDSVGVSEPRTVVEYDSDEENKEPEESDLEVITPLEIVNSRLLEPVYSQGDKDDVDIDVVPSYNENLSAQASEWLATEIFPKAMTPRRSASPQKSQIPEPKEPTPESSPVSIPEPPPVPPPKPDRNLSKDVSDWLSDNILDKAQQEAAERKISKEVGNWLQNEILTNAKLAAESSKKPKPTPPEPVKVSEPKREPSFTKAGSHASSPGDRLFGPLENYPNNMDEDNFKSQNIPTAPLTTPSQVSKEDEPMSILEDYPPQYSRSKDSPSTFDSKSPSPKPIVTPPMKSESPSKAGSHSSSPRDSLFSPLEDHPSNLSDRAVSLRSKSPSNQHKTPSPKPLVPPKDKPKAIPIEDQTRDSSPTPSKADASSIKSTIKAEGTPSSHSELHPHIKLKTPSPGSEGVFYGAPIRKDDRIGPDEANVNKWLDEEILTPAAAENWVDNKILKEAQKVTDDNQNHPEEPQPLENTESTDSSKRHSAEQIPSSGMEEQQVEDWLENEVLIPAQVDGWVDKKVLSPAEKEKPFHHGQGPKAASPSGQLFDLELGSSKAVTPFSQPVDQGEGSLKSQSLSSQQIENWVSEEVTDPAAASSWVQSEVLEPAEVSAAVEEQILEPASSRALVPSPTIIKLPIDETERFDTSVVTPVSLQPSEKTSERPLEQKPADDDSLSWVDSSHNFSPFRPHPDHPGDAQKKDITPMFPDQKTSSAPLSGPEQHPEGAPSGYPSGFPTSVYGKTLQPQQQQQPQQQPGVYGQPFDYPSPWSGSPVQAPSSPMYWQQPGGSPSQPDASPAQPAYGFASRPVSLLPTPHPEQSRDPHSKDEPSPTALPSDPKEATLAPTSSRSPAPEVDKEDSWGPQLPQPSTSYKQALDKSRGADTTEKKRTSILKNAAYQLKETSPPRKTSKTETRTSLIEKRAIQQDNYLTRDDDEDYKRKSPVEIVNRRKTSSTSSSVKRRRSDSFLSNMERSPSSDKKHSFFGRLCPPISKIIQKHKSPTRSKKKSAGSSYDSYDDQFPPIPTKESKDSKTVKPVAKHEGRPRSNSDIELGMIPFHKESKPKPIREESAVKPMSQQAAAEQPAEITPIHEQPKQSGPFPIYGPPSQAASGPIYGPPPQGFPNTIYGQPGPSAPFSPYGQSLPAYGQPAQGFPSGVYGNQFGQPSPLPYQASSVGAPTFLESKYPEDIQTSTLPKFVDYKEASKRRVKPEKSEEAPRIPQPPKKGFPTFPDYRDLTAPKDKLAAEDHSWYDADGQPSPSHAVSRDMFPGDSVTNQAEPSVSSEMGDNTPEHSKVSDVKKQDADAKGSTEKYGPAKPMPPGDGIPLFSDYYNVSAGEFPTFRDVPKTTPSHYRPQNNQQPPGMFPSGLPYPAQPVQTIAPNASQPQKLLNQSVQLNASDTLPAPNLHKPWETPASRPQHSATHPAQSQRPWEIPSSRPKRLAMQPAESRSQRPWDHASSLPQSSTTYPPESRTRLGELPLLRPPGSATHLPESHPQRPWETLNTTQPLPPKITKHSYSNPDRPLSELMQNDLAIPEQGYQKPASIPKFQQGMNPDMQPTQVDATQPHLQDHGSKSYDYPQGSTPTFQKPESQQLGRTERTLPASSQMSSIPKPGMSAPEEQYTKSPFHKPSQPPTPWEIPSSRPYNPNEHQMPSMRKPGDYDRRQMFDPSGPPNPAPGSRKPVPVQKPYSSPLGQTPSRNMPDSSSQKFYSANQASENPGPGQKPYSPSSGQTPEIPSLTKNYYLQPDRPVSELLHPHAPPNLQDELPGGARKENAPVPPGGGIPKFGDYDKIVQADQPQISGDHDPNTGKRKIVTAAEKKAQIEREMQPFTQQMEELKKQMYLLTSQKGPPIRTGPQTPHLPTSSEFYHELEKRTMDAMKKGREESRAEQRKKIYEENARRKVRRAIERSKTTK